MAQLMKSPIFLLCLLACFWQSCEAPAESGEEEQVEMMPEEMPEDFYVAIREKGGGEPSDNVYYLSVDSASREAYYYDFHSLSAYRPAREDVESIYQALRNLKPWDIGVRTDQVNRVYDRGGELFEIGMTGCRIDRSNAEKQHVLEASLPAFQQVTSTVRDAVLAGLRPQLRPLRLQLNFKENADLSIVSVTANDFPLIDWERSKEGEHPPMSGQNAVLPGDYHLFIHVRTDLGPASIQDSIRISDHGRDLELEIYRGSVEIKKLN